VGLVVRERDKPSWLRILAVLGTDAIVGVMLLGFGIYYVAHGNHAGRLVGLCLIVGGVIAFAWCVWTLWDVSRRRRKVR
jgi:Na+/melibiose symporter-like transporter